MTPARSSSRAGSRLLAGAVLAFLATLCARNPGQQEPAFAPLQAAALAGALAAGAQSEGALADVAQAYALDSSSIQLSELPVNMGGKGGGGLDGTYTMKPGAKKSDFNDDEKAIRAEQKFEAKFDEYIGVFGVLFVGAFIAPMVTYFWYVRDTDPWEN